MLQCLVTFHQHENPNSIYDVGLTKMLVSSKVWVGKKIFQIFNWLQWW